LKYYLFSVFALIMLSACGSNNDAKSRSTNSLPSVSVDNSAGVEGTSVQLSANAQDSDGSIVNYAWQQIDGTDATLSPNGNELTIDLPAVLENEELKFEITVTDDKGAASSTEFKVEVLPLIISVELSGSVHLRFAHLGEIVGKQYRVWTEIGGETFETTADDSGDFSLPISVDDSKATQIVTLFAAPSDPNSIIKFASVLPPMFNLSELAGEDHKIDTSDLSGLQLSPFSTSLLTLLQHKTTELPTDYAEYLQLQDTLNLGAIIEQATINYVISAAESNGGYYFAAEVLAFLPADFDNLVDSLADPVLNKAVGDKFDDMFHFLIREAHQNSFFKESTIELTETNLKPTMILENVRLYLNDDGTGLYGDDPITWTISGSELVLNFDTSADFVFYTKLVLTARMMFNDQILFTNVKHSRPSYSETKTETYTFTDVAVPTSRMLSPLEAIEMGVEYLTEFSDIKTDAELSELGNVSILLDKKRLTFNKDDGENNQGTVEIDANQLDENNNVVKQSLIGEWSTKDNVLSITYDQQSIEVVFLDHNDSDNTYYINIQQSRNDSVKAHYTTFRLSPTMLPFTEEQVAQLIIHRSNSLPNYSEWSEFKDDGTFFEIEVRDENGDGIFDENQEYFQVHAGIWRIVNGSIETLLHKKYNDSFRESECFSNDWHPTLDNDCVANEKTVYQWLGTKEPDVQMFEIHTYKYDDLKESGRWGMRESNEPFVLSKVYDYLQTYQFSEQQPFDIPESILEQAKEHGSVNKYTFN